MLAGTVVGTVLYGSYRSYKAYVRKVQQGPVTLDDTAVAIHVKPDPDSPPPVPKRTYAEIVATPPINTSTELEETQKEVSTDV